MVFIPSRSTSQKHAEAKRQRRFVTLLSKCRTRLNATHCAAGLIMAVVLCAPAQAQQSETVEFNLPAQSLEQALKSYGIATNRQVMFATDIVEGKTADALSGPLEPTEALDRLLAGTGLIYETTPSNVILVKTARETSSDAQSPRSNAREQQNQDREESPRNEPESDDETEQEEPLDLGRVAVRGATITGTNIRDVNPVGSSITVVDRDEIERSGYSSVQEVIQSIPQNSQAGAVSNFGAAAINRGDNTTLATGINLRGLGARSSLTLLNGRRLAPGTRGTFVDVSTIPLAAIDRVEVLADGASAIYGSDAVAGVVNFILRDDYEGAETSLSYRDTTQGGGREYQFFQLWGSNWRTGNLLLGYEFTDRERIANARRRATENCDLSDRGGDNFCSIQSSPGNITRIGTMPVSRAIPFGQDGSSLDEADLIDGVLNTFNNRAVADLFPEEERHGAFGRFSQALSDDVEVFIEGFFGRRDALFIQNRSGINLTVPESNAYRQLNGLFPGQGDLVVQYNFTPDLGPVRIDTQSEGWRATAGIEVELTENWTLDVFANWAEQQENASVLNSTTGNIAALNQALASSDPSTSFNPFADGSNTPQSVLDRIGGGRINQTLDSELFNAGVRTTGRLFELPAGSVRLAAGLEYREEDARYEESNFDSDGNLTMQFPGPLQPAFNRDIKAAYAEFFIPIFGENHRLTGFEELLFTAAVRYEDYSDFGSTVNPKFGASWSPISGLRFRGSYGTSFSVANLNDNLTPANAFVVPLPGFIDPNATDGFTNTLFIGGGNPNLDPEEGETYTLGIEITPEAIPGLFIGASYFDVSIEDAITSINDIRVLFADEQAFAGAGALIRNPTAEQVNDALANVIIPPVPLPDPNDIELIAFVAPVNSGLLTARGLDLETSYVRATPIGQIDLSLRGSFLFELSQSPAPGIDPTRNEGEFTFPSDFSGRALFTWSNRGWAVTTAINHVASYDDNLSNPVRTIDSWTTVDAQISYRIGSAAARGWGLDGTEISLSVTNLLNEDPPFVNALNGVAYDPANANPIGRQIGARITKRW